MTCHARHNVVSLLCSQEALVVINAFSFDVIEKRRSLSLEVRSVLNSSSPYPRLVIAATGPRDLLWHDIPSQWREMLQALADRCDLLSRFMHQGVDSFY